MTVLAVLLVAVGIGGIAIWLIKSCNDNDHRKTMFARVC